MEPHSHPQPHRVGVRLRVRLSQRRAHVSGWTAHTATGVEEVATDGVAGYTTIRLTLTLDDTQQNIYALAGTPVTLR